LAVSAPARAATPNPTTLVDTFIGTSGTPIGGPIDTFPGADVPFGMVQWSPDTPSQNAGGGYEYSDHDITGFSLTHLSGPGCSVFGDFGVLPTTGAIPADPASARAPFSHADEESAPGWYAVSLGAPKIRTELSVTRHSGIARFTFPSAARANLLFNVSSNQAGVTDASVRIDGPDRISGSASSGFFCGMPDQYTVYFSAHFNRAFSEYGTWNGTQVSRGTSSARGPNAGAWVTFDATLDPRVVVTVGVSFVSVAGARANLDAEERGWDPVAIRNRATEMWAGMLRRIDISGGTAPEQRTFYTAFYHALLHPNVISDVTGLYTGFDGRVHRVRTGHDEYANYSDWDIYRTEVPLLALIAPGETSDMMQSLVDAARQDQGWLPRWALVNGPTSVMGGDSLDAVIAGAYAFGARDFDARSALAAMVKGATTTSGPPGQGWYIPRWELNSYLNAGYVVNEYTTSVSPGPNGASETLEYAFDDFAIARVANALHDARTYRTFMRRSSSWMALFNSAARSIEPRNGDLTTMAFMNAPLTENGQSGFQEGNGAQYTWMVPHDLRDLVAAMGGAPAAAAKLDTFFSDLNAGPDKPYAWLGNEPSLGTPWVYLSVGQPWRAQAIVREALTTLYADKPDGLPGNDDLGTMSAWYIWCAMGLYPQNPAVRYLDVGAPLFSSIVVRSPNGPTITISSPNSSAANPYVEALRVNGAPAGNAWVVPPIRGTLRLDQSVGERPNAQWGADAAAAPPSYATTPLSVPLATAASFVTPATVRVDAGGSASLDVKISNRTGTATTFVAWRSVAPQGLRVDRSSNNVEIAAGATATVGLRLYADASLRAGYYAVRIEGIASNGARLDPLPVYTRVDRGNERPELAYAENAFGNSITPIDLATGATGPDIAVGEYPRNAALSPDGNRLYVVNLGGNSVSIVDTLRQRVTATVKTGGSPSGIALTPDGRTLWIANGDDGTIAPIDTASLQSGEAIRVGSRPRAIAISPTGTTLYVSNGGSNTVSVVDLRARSVEGSIAVGRRPAGLAISPNGERLFVVNSADNDVTPIDLTGAGRALPAIPVGVYPVQIAIARDGRLAYVTNYGNSTVTPIDLVPNKPREPLEVGGAPYGIAIASNGRMAIVVSHRDNSAVLIDAGRVARRIPLGSGPYTIAAP
ncbi:MAG TPA: GH92 family glycosyl hydrolase, partial [Candidatus Dormibacteraeota bacterium]|nr:GH92 family glycosyl hydrolase [Candidatus Dormibacteraeota bacterium]